MTRKVYKSAMGKPVDLGALMLQNEQVRAVGNMGVNAAGHVLDSNNKIIDKRSNQVQRQYKRQTNVSVGPVSSGTKATKEVKPQQVKQPSVELDLENAMEKLAKNESDEPKQNTTVTETGGLAAAIARSREVKQELEKTLRQQRREQGIKPI